MENPNIGRIIRVGSSEAIIIPAKIRRALKWLRGDRVVFGVYDNNTIAVRRLLDDELKKLKPEDVTF